MRSPAGVWFLPALMELFIIYRRCKQLLKAKNIEIGPGTRIAFVIKDDAILELYEQK